jgi:hypothetical protein
MSLPHKISAPDAEEQRITMKPFEILAEPSLPWFQIAHRSDDDGVLGCSV